MGAEGRSMQAGNGPRASVIDPIGETETLCKRFPSHCSLSHDPLPVVSINNLNVLGTLYSREILVCTVQLAPKLYENSMRRTTMSCQSTVIVEVMEG